MCIKNKYGRDNNVGMHYGLINCYIKRVVPQSFTSLRKCKDLKIRYPMHVYESYFSGFFLLLSFLPRLTIPCCVIPNSRNLPLIELSVNMYQKSIVCNEMFIHLNPNIPSKKINIFHTSVEKTLQVNTLKFYLGRSILLFISIQLYQNNRLE